MSNVPAGQERGAPPEEFVQLVKQALENLYDYRVLQRHPLAPPGTGGAGTPSAAEQLQQSLVAAVSMIAPAQGSAVHPQARVHDLLRLRYVEGLTVSDAAARLGVSLRQAYRDLALAEDRLAELLWSRLAAPPHAPSGEIADGEAEISGLVLQPELLDLRPLVQRACAAVDNLAHQRGISLSCDLPQSR